MGGYNTPVIVVSGEWSRHASRLTSRRCQSSRRFHQRSHHWSQSRPAARRNTGNSTIMWCN